MKSALAEFRVGSLIGRLSLMLFVNGLRGSLLTIGGRLIYSPRYLLVGQLVYGTKLICQSSSFLQQFPIPS